MARNKDRLGDRRDVTCGAEVVRQQERQEAASDRLGNHSDDQRRSGIAEVAIDAIRVRNYTGFVYDFEVANTHNYLANGLLSSNSTAKTYRRVIKYFRQNPHLKTLLVTATPQRSDGVGLWNVVDTCAYSMELKTAIDDGWLCPIRQSFVEVHGLDLSAVKTKAGGDLSDGEVERQFLGDTDAERERLLHEVAKPSIEQAKGRPLLIFASGVKHATELAAACNAYDGVSAEVVVGDTNKDERKRIIGRYKTGETNVLVGCGVFTEGFDAPATEVVAMARPTKSLSLYLQCIGRGTRPLPGVVDGIDTAEGRRAAIAASAKPSCVVLDFVGNAGRHKLVSVADCLAGSAADPLDIEEAIAEAKELDDPADMEELIEKAKAAREERQRLAEEAERKRLSTRNRAENCDYSSQDIDLFRGDPFEAIANYTQQKGGASEKQVKFLVQLGVSPETAMQCSSNQAGSMLDKLTKQRGGDYILRGGKHRGKKLKQVPAGYQKWLMETDAMGAAEHVLEMWSSK